MNRLFIVSIAACALAVAGQPAPGQDIVRYDPADLSMAAPDRGWCNLEGDGAGYTNSGYWCSNRLSKYAGHECLVFDWQDPAPITDWMAANPLLENQRYKFELVMTSAGGFDTDTIVRYEVRTLNMSVDWEEGTGPDHIYRDFNWLEGEYAATNWFAQTVYVDPDGLPGNGDEYADTGNCVPWTNHDGVTEYGQLTGNVDALGRHVNGVVDINQDGDTDDLGENEPIYLVCDNTADYLNTGIPDVGMPQVSVELQYIPGHPSSWHPLPLLNDILDNADNLGMLFANQRYWNPDTGQWEEMAGPPYGNGGVFTDDADKPMQNNEGYKAYIQMTIDDLVDGDATDDDLADGADYTLWADNYSLTAWAPSEQQGGWKYGNWNDDNLIDGGDYTLWADNYTSPASVPEPALLSLLGLGAAALLKRKR